MMSFDQDLLSLTVALALGAFIGLERELSDKAAGLRTNILICVGSCLFAILSRHLAYTAGSDTTRIAAQIVSGIGFLGAGAIIRYGMTIRGLTTAACLWTAAGIGMACGMGYWKAPSRRRARCSSRRLSSTSWSTSSSGKRNINDS